MPVYIALRHPYIADLDFTQMMLGFTQEGIDSITDQLNAAGHDGVILEFEGGTQEIAVFDPRRVKSATGNTGAFSGESDDIRFSRRSDLNNYPDEREGSGIEEDPEALFADVDDAIRKGGGWNEAKGELEKQTLGRLAHVMHESTLAGVDGAEDYVPSIDKKDAIKQIGILKRRMLSVLGDDKWPMLTEIQTL